MMFKRRRLNADDALTTGPGPPRVLRSDAERLQVAHALHREIPVLLDEVVLQPTGLRRGEDFGPVGAVLSDGQPGGTAAASSGPSAGRALRPSRRRQRRVQVHALSMHRGEPPGI